MQLEKIYEIQYMNKKENFRKRWGSGGGYEGGWSPPAPSLLKLAFDCQSFKIRLLLLSLRDLEC